MSQAGAGTFGEWLRRHRVAAGLTQEELAERAGLSVRAISDMERGRTSRPRHSTVHRIAGALQLTPEAQRAVANAARRGNGRANPAWSPLPAALESPASRAAATWPGDGGLAGTGHDGRNRAALAIPAGPARPAVGAPVARGRAVAGPGPDGAARPGAADAATPGPAGMIPRQLPAGVAHFTGRAAELAALARHLDQDGHEAPATMVISAIAGTAGVGKTALAVSWAHRVAGRFPDGQLYVNLRGYDPAQPLTAGDALAGFLRALGVPSPEIPADTDERAARYRSLLAGRRMLVLLDNASEVEQVRPLLPGAAGCLAVVTSRDSLAGLVARDGARRLDLGLLPAGDAVGLLRALIGERVDEDRAAAGALAAQCARLPLALRVAAELAAGRPGIPLTGLVRELAGQQRRLDLLAAGGDPRTAVRAVFSWSCQHLDEAPARLFRLLGTSPGGDFDAYAAAALAGVSLREARHLLDVLARAHLIQPAGTGRYELHDLLRLYAAEQAGADSGPGRHAALTRLFGYYLGTAAAAMDTLFPAEHSRRPAVPPPATPAPPVAGEAAARAWLDTERANLAAVCAHTAEGGWPGHATRLATILFRYLSAGGHDQEATTVHAHARSAAHRTGDQAAEAAALIGLSALEIRRGRYPQAIGHLTQAQGLARRAGDRTGQARAASTLGNICLRQGRYPQAAVHHREALALHQAGGDRAGTGRALVNLGIADMLQGRYQQATGHLRQALAIRQAAGDRLGEAHTLTNLGEVCLRQGDCGQAARHLGRALSLFRQAGHRTGEVHALTSLGDAYQRQGRYPEATDQHWQALVLCRETGNRTGEAEALNGLGEIALATGQPGPAHSQHTAALALATEIGEQDQQARAHHGLARARSALGDLAGARHHWQEALARYASLGSPEADQVRADLARAGGGRPLQP